MDVVKKDMKLAGAREGSRRWLKKAEELPVRPLKGTAKTKRPKRPRKTQAFPFF